MNFGKWIVVSFVLFTLFIATLVAVCVRQDINLVSKDYYKEELAHQQKMTLIKNTQSLESLPSLSLSGNVLIVSFADLNKIQKGEVRLLRPSDSRLDKKFKLNEKGKLVQQFPLEVWSKGLYRAVMQWTMDGKEFYYEKLIVL